MLSWLMENLTESLSLSVVIRFFVPVRVYVVDADSKIFDSVTGRSAKERAQPNLYRGLTVQIRTLWCCVQIWNHQWLHGASSKILCLRLVIEVQILSIEVMSRCLMSQEGIAVGRSLALATGDQIDGNKEMIAFGMMNVVGSFTSCYLTTGMCS